MALQYGRLHERMGLVVKITLSDPNDPGIVEDGMTDNVSAEGARVCVSTAKQPGTLLSVYSPTHQLRSPARVVYCERIPGDRFAVGLELQGLPVQWKKIGR